MNISNRYKILIGSLLLVGFFVYLFSDLVAYILVAWVISMIGAPLARFFRKSKYISNGMSAILTLFVFGLGFLLLLRIFIPPLSEQARNLASIDYNQVAKNLEEPLNDWEEWLGGNGILTMPISELEKNIQEPEKPTVVTQVVDLDSLLLANNLGDSLSPNQNITLLVNVNANHIEDNSQAEQMAPDESLFDQLQQKLFSFLDPSFIPKLFSNVVGTLSNAIIGLFSVLFIAFFFLQEQKMFNNIISSLVPDEYEAQTLNAIKESSDLLIRYFSGILVQMTAITLFVSILLSVLGVKNALLIGFFAALMNVIPYVGPILGAGFAFLITISSNLDHSFYNEMLPLLGKIAAVFGVMQMLDNFILQPNIFSRSVKAHPLEIFFVVLMGAKIGGVGGMVLAIPAYTVLRVVAREFLSQFKIVQSITKGLDAET